VLKAEMDLDALHAKRLTLFGVSNKLRNAEQRATTVRGFSEKVLPLIAAGRIKPLVDRVYPFDELPAAAGHLQANAHVGKIVVTIK
jgi:NADPH:quinone reductase-like Zn-dependent oxidoreductase